MVREVPKLNNSSSGSNADHFLHSIVIFRVINLPSEF